MRASLRRAGVVLVLAPFVVLTGVSAAAATYVSGRYLPVDEMTGKMTGSLNGTWKIKTFKVIKNSPVFYAKGTEEFTGCIDQNRDGSCTGDPTGTMRFSFRYWAKMKGKDVQLGTCAHRLTDATGGLAGTTGFIQMVDTPKPKGRGVITRFEGDLQPAGVTATRARAARTC